MWGFQWEGEQDRWAGGSGMCICRALNESPQGGWSLPGLYRGLSVWEMSVHRALGKRMSIRGEDECMQGSGYWG